MKLKIKHLTYSLVFALCLITPCLAAEISDLIQPVKVYCGKQDTVLVSDMFYAKVYDLKFSENDKLIIIYDQKQNTAIFQPKNNFIGATLAEFTLQGTKYSFPVIVQSDKVTQQLITFSYKPEGKVSKVAVSGSFNNWNKEKDRLTDVAGTGVYELSLPLDPGNYIYKFVVDGKEILDPGNREKSPTGFDDFNSVLRVSDVDTAKIFLHIGAKKENVRGCILFLCL